MRASLLPNLAKASQALTLPGLNVMPQRRTAG